MSTMRDRTQLCGDIFTFDGWDEGGYYAVIHHDAEMLVDFGPFKEGERIHRLLVNFLAGTMTELRTKEEGDVKKRSVRFTLTPV